MIVNWLIVELLQAAALLLTSWVIIIVSYHCQLSSCWVAASGSNIVSSVYTQSSTFTNNYSTFTHNGSTFTHNDSIFTHSTFTAHFLPSGCISFIGVKPSPVFTGIGKLTICGQLLLPKMAAFLKLSLLDLLSTLYVGTSIFSRLLMVHSKEAFSHHYMKIQLLTISVSWLLPCATVLCIYCYSE